MGARRVVLFAMCPEISSATGVFKVARGLLARGHRVAFLSVPDFADYIAEHGFEVSTILHEIVPKGTFKYSMVPGVDTAPSGPPAAEPTAAGSIRRWLQGLRRSRATAAAHSREEMLRTLESDVRKAVDDRGADVALVDPLIWPMGFAAFCAGTSVLHISSALVQRIDAHMPPASSAEIPTGTPYSQLRVAMAWNKVLIARTLRTRVHALTGGLRDEYAILKRRLRRAGIDTVTADHGRQLNVPTISLIPRAFDFPSQRVDPQRIYMSATVDAAKPEPPVDWSAIDPDRRLAVASLGTYTWYPHARRFYAAVVEAFRSKPGWTVVLNIGRLRAADFGPVPSHVRLQNGISQVTLLTRASVMITQAGLQSTREAIAHGVPLVCFPCAMDQPGIAARVVHHGLGVRGDIRTVDAATLSQLVDTVADDDGYRSRVAAMREAFLDPRAFEAGLDFIETFVNARPALARAS